jgi:hypothetical protein
MYETSLAQGRDQRVVSQIMYVELVVRNDKRNLPETIRTLYIVMVRHYGAVLEAVLQLHRYLAVNAALQRYNIQLTTAEMCVCIYRVFHDFVITAGGNFLSICDEKSSYKHVSDFGRLRSLGIF